MFGASPWTFDHKGVRFIGLDTVSRAQDYWTARNMSPEERMGAMATLDGALGGAWAGLGREQLDYLDSTLSGWPTDQPVVIFSHNPLYEYYPPWNFWVRDWRQVHEIVAPYQKITNLHGHTHQVLYNEIGAMRSIGQLATSWPWPYAPEGVPALTKPMVRADPGDHFDGVGWGRVTFQRRPAGGRARVHDVAPGRPGDGAGRLGDRRQRHPGAVAAAGGPLASRAMRRNRALLQRPRQAAPARQERLTAAGGQQGGQR